MNFVVIGMIIMQAARLACGTCVLQSDFGFNLNCNFKKSGLFRVRNLGGVKAHIGLGFSVGDELGFPESLGNLEDNRRRAIHYKNLGPPGPSSIGVLPANAQPIENQNIVAQSNVNITPELREYLAKQSRTKKRGEANVKQGKQIGLMTEAQSLPLGVPPFRPIPNRLPVIREPPSAQRRNQIAMDTVNTQIRINNKLVDAQHTQGITNHTIYRAPQPGNVKQPAMGMPMALPNFQVMPDSALKTIPAPSHLSKPNYLQLKEPTFDLKGITVEELARAANVSVDTIKHAIYIREQQMRAEHRAMLAAKLRQEFIRTSTMKPVTKTPATTIRTTTTTTLKPFIIMPEPMNLENMVAKVMNAPKEYYPVGYEKNFDDNFKSKVDLPPTSFTCTKQKHFPGLYADTDLGCMVFHVCALTDDGMIRKSFLCPEDTLFDQTILKCNWWFYVDCMSSPSIYDSNIPISKSYQLMKSLSYFSQYAKNSRDSNDSNDSNLTEVIDKRSQNQDDNDRDHIELLRKTMNHNDQYKSSSSSSLSVTSLPLDEHHQHLNES